MKYNFMISHVPGKDLIIADTFSRAPITAASESNQIFQKEADCFVDVVVEILCKVRFVWQLRTLVYTLF